MPIKRGKTTFRKLILSHARSLVIAPQRSVEQHSRGPLDSEWIFVNATSSLTGRE